MSLLTKLKPNLQDPQKDPPPYTPPALPPNWQMHMDPATNRPYYHNRLTGHTTWERPALPAAAPPPAYTPKEGGHSQLSGSPVVVATKAAAGVLGRGSPHGVADGDLRVFACYGPHCEEIISCGTTRKSLPLRVLIQRFQQSQQQSRQTAGVDLNAVPELAAFCPGRGFLAAESSLTCALRVGSRKKDEYDIAIGLLPVSVLDQEQRSCKLLATVASEAAAIASDVESLRKGSSPPSAASPGRKTHQILQERITQLLLRLDTIDTSEFTRILRKMQVEQLLGLSKDISAATNYTTVVK